MPSLSQKIRFEVPHRVVVFRLEGAHLIDAGVERGWVGHVVEFDVDFAELVPDAVQLFDGLFDLGAVRLGFSSVFGQGDHTPLSILYSDPACFNRKKQKLLVIRARSGAILHSDFKREASPAGQERKAQGRCLAR